jgi:hypothetical protein
MSITICQTQGFYFFQAVSLYADEVFQLLPPTLSTFIILPITVHYIFPYAFRAILLSNPTLSTAYHIVPDYF